MASENNEDLKSVNLQVVTPKGKAEDTSVDLVTLPGVEGMFGVMPGHAPFFTLLAPGVISYEEGGMPRMLSVSGGFVEVTNSKVLVLARTCETKDDIDVDRAQKSKQEMEDKLSTMSFEDEGRKHIEERLHRAISRISVAKGEDASQH